MVDHDDWLVQLLAKKGENKKVMGDASAKFTNRLVFFLDYFPTIKTAFPKSSFPLYQKDRNNGLSAI